MLQGSGTEIGVDNMTRLWLVVVVNGDGGDGGVEFGELIVENDVNNKKKEKLN